MYLASPDKMFDPDGRKATKKTYNRFTNEIEDEHMKSNLAHFILLIASIADIRYKTGNTIKTMGCLNVMNKLWGAL
jgi:hypothetical protein